MHEELNRPASVPDAGDSDRGREVRHRTVRASLAALDDADLTDLLSRAAPLGTGIGGTTATVSIAGVPVFVKRIPLTDLEQRPEHVGSTRNIFELSTFYQYGFGSTGFGAWRELAAHRMASDWVRQGRFAGFPLLYHWRSLPQRPAPMTPAATETWVRRWGGSAAVRRRLTAINEASASLVLFMEYVPHRLDIWLADLASSLAVHAGFDLTPAESGFLEQHRNYDRCFTATQFTFWLIGDVCATAWPDSLAYLRANRAAGYPELPAAARALVQRHAPIAELMGSFWRRMELDRTTPYPYVELDEALTALAAPVRPTDRRQ
ncbi:hypothetical protein [Micromonospora sp. LOL_023]|uniref:hypothetical protein n=1 Tax=Micromonospora sp. LOL_023 TaxID=3345418 RepID=UPI003A8B699F